MRCSERSLFLAVGASLVFAFAALTAACSSLVRAREDGGIRDGDGEIGEGDIAGDADHDYEASDGAVGCEARDECFFWVQTFGSRYYNFISGLAMDSRGNIYVTQNSRDYSGPGRRVDQSFVATYRTNGEERWIHPMIANDGERLNGIDIDDVGNIFVTGSYLLTRFSSEGVLRWQSPGVTSAGGGLAVATDRERNVFIGGYFGHDVDLGEGTITAVDGDDLFIASYSTEGQYQGSLVVGGEGHQYIDGIAADDNGAIYVVGYFSGHGVDMGGGPCPRADTQSDVVIASYWAEDLTHRWSHCFGGPSIDTPSGFDIDARGNIYVTGSFRETVDFGGEELSATESGPDAFVASYTSEGTLRWARRFGGVGLDQGRGLTVSEGVGVVVTGWFRETIDFDGTVLTSEGDTDVFLAALFPEDGSVRYALRFGGAGMDGGDAVAIGECGDTYVAGFFSGSVDLVGEVRPGFGSYDAFLMRLCDPGSQGP